MCRHVECNLLLLFTDTLTNHGIHQFQNNESQYVRVADRNSHTNQLDDNLSTQYEANPTVVTLFAPSHLIYLEFLGKQRGSIEEITLANKRVTSTTPIFLPRIDSVSTYRSDKNHFDATVFATT